ncbi:MAG: precorrin-2 dehydrogenase/sirohydrochlorin ferrochelatase family protein [Acidimicrobiales bacterium]
MTLRYPVLLDLAGAPCLVVGGGAVAERKVRGLLAVDADVTVLAPDLRAGLAEVVAAGQATWAEGRYERGRAGGGWRFVVAATDAPSVNAEVVDDATATGTWANDATAPTGGPAALPAVERRGAVTVTVSTGGAHPGAARWLCDLAAAAVGPEHAAAVDLVAEVQAEAPAVAGPDGPSGAGRPDWRAAVDSGMLDLIRTGRRAEAKERLQACLSSSSD